MRKMVRKGQKIPWIQSLDLGCAHVSCLQYNVTLGMTQFGHMDQDQSVQVLCWDHEFLWDTTEIWPQGQERGIWRAVPSQHLAEIVEDCECHERLLALTTGCWPLMEAKGWSVVTSGLVQGGGLFVPQLQLLQLQSRLLLFSFGKFLTL